MTRRRRVTGGAARRQKLQRRRADDDRFRARAAALAAGRPERSLTAQLMGDPLPGRSARESGSAWPPAQERERIGIAGPCPVLVMDVLEALNDPDEVLF